jgi:hypothetical protein
MATDHSTIIGTSWLRTYRTFLLDNVKFGDTHTWGSDSQSITLTMAQVEELSAQVAKRAQADLSAKQKIVSSRND